MTVDYKDLTKNVSVLEADDFLGSLCDQLDEALHRLSVTRKCLFEIILEFCSLLSTNESEEEGLVLEQKNPQSIHQS